MADESQNDPTKSFVTLSTGTMVSQYRIVEKIGAGGMGRGHPAEGTELKEGCGKSRLASHRT